ncbi:MAG: TonB-dependent receptor [Verrucomicrobiota bacterium]
MKSFINLLMSSFAAAAWTADGATILPEQIVEARSLAVSTSLDISQSRAELANTPGGTEVVAAERYLTGRASTLADTFALSAGVVAQPRFGSDEARISIRGSGLQRTFHGRGILVLQDGMPINLADGGFDMQSLDPAAASHIHVWRGANALVHGSSTLGGAIEYISPTGRTAPGGFARIEGGSWDYLRSTIAAGFASETTDAWSSLTVRTQNGFRDHAEQETLRWSANFGWQPAAHIENRTFLSIVKSRSELPGNLTKAEMEDDPSQADNSLFGAVAYDNRRDYEHLRFSNHTAVVNGPHAWSFITGYSYKDLDHPITPFVGVIDQLSHDTFVGAGYAHEGEIGGRTHQFRAGLNWQHGITDNATFANLPGGTRAPLTGDADQTADNFSLYAEEQLGLGGGFTGILGASAAYNIRDNDVNTGTAMSYDRNYENISPKAGIRYDANHWQAYGNVSRSYEPPSFSEAVASAVANDAQQATTVELGARGSHAFIGWDASVYHAQLENEFLALNDATGTPLGTVNSDRTIHEGIELALEADLFGRNLDAKTPHRLMFRSAWTYGNFTFDDDPVYGDNQIAGLPPHLVRGQLLWENDHGWYAGPTFEWVPEKSFIDHANTFSADPHALLGFKFGVRRETGLSWFIEAKNLTDQTHAATTGVIADAGGTDARAFLPGDGRSVFAGLEWKW